ncbi:30S ribosomal protein S19 [Candidatus Woesearchaeota archaeon]|nr:30S ribosomal protein S19 [Candidatus Woesearchaeota archaeon]
MAKELRWHGLTEEDVRKLDLKEFMRWIPSRSRRALKKGFTEQEKILLRNVQKNQVNIETHCRDMVIVPQLLDKTIKVHAGREFVPVIITSEMLGHRLGEFAQTRKSVSHSAAGIGATRSSKAVSAR